MRKSFSPSFSNCNSVLANKIFGIPLDELQHEGQTENEVPFIVRHIVEYIEEHGGLEQAGFFQVNGKAETVEWLRQRYNNGEEVDLVKEADVPSAVSLLRVFLQELPEPVIPASLRTHLMQLYEDYNSEDEFGRKLKCFLLQLPPVNFNLLKFLCRFLANVASNHEDTWTASALAAVFGPDVFHFYTYVEDVKEQEMASRVMTGLLENYYDYFEAEDEDFSSTNDLSSITEQISDYLEDDDDKLEPSEDLLDDSVVKSDEMLGVTEDIMEPSSVPASTSAPISAINILPASADILERTIRAAVEQHLFDLQSSIDREFKHLEKPLPAYEAEGKNAASEREEPNENDTTEGNTSEDSRGSLEALLCTLQLEDKDTSPPFQNDNQESQPSSSYQEEKGQTVDLLLDASTDNADKKALIDEENNIKTTRQRSDSCPECVTISSVATLLNSHSKVCDLNANTESQVPRQEKASSQEAGVLHEIPRLDLKSISIENECEAPCPITFPLIDFKTMHHQRDGEESFPAFTAWHEDSDSGEAQLSPQAGRMSHHPLEDDTHPLLSRRYLDFGCSQRFLQDPETLASSSKALPFVRTRRASFSSKDEEKEDATPFLQVRRLQKKIKQFEEQFEKEKKYKPSYGDKVANSKVLKWMTELTKLRKQIKGFCYFLFVSLNADAKLKSSDGEFPPPPRPRSNTLPKSFGSSLEHDNLEDEHGKEKKPTKEDTLELILQRLKEKRAETEIPEDVKKMTKDQLATEKVALQKNLRYYESIHGRPVTREERHTVRPLYDRYRLVKQMLTRASIIPIIGSPSTKRRGQILQPIIEGETAHFFEEIKEEEEDNISPSTDLTITLKVPCQTEEVSAQMEKPEPDDREESGKLVMDLRLSSSHASSMPELLEQFWKAKAEKKKLRKTLKDFEEEFYQQNGRNVQKEDRTPMVEEYREYKRVKAKLRLLEVLISKQDSSKSI
ncbi:protein FAM13B isoform X2 [Latimeria chalumnae]|uniref:protein FAM13B isoform X2 n=1 Tax=Latimeria chalumnae TaxID=7897 RepID=UPI00313EF0C9